MTNRSLWKDVKSGYTHFKNGDIGVAKITPCFENRKSVIFDNLDNGFGAGTTELHIIRVNNHLLTKYIFWFIKTEKFIKDGIRNFSGAVGQQRIGKDFLTNLLLPLPPLAEQQRIVSAIEKAFEQIDIIEKNKLNLKNYIKQTKSKVLDLAIRGKLVEQDSNDGNAFELLEKIRNEKLSHGFANSYGICDGKNKKSSFIIKAEDGKHYEQFADGTLKDIEEEIPFEIPENWCWCIQNDVCKLSDGEKVVGKEYPYLDVKYLRGTKEKTVVSSGKFVKAGTKIILVDGENSGEIFTTPEDGYMGSTFKALSFENSDENFVRFFIMSKKDLYKNNKTGSAIPHLNKQLFKTIPIPLPPLAEQKRIIKKIEQIFEQLDILEKSLGE